MGAPLTIEQIIVNHNIGVNIADAKTLQGYPASSFAFATHQHDASNITTGIINPARLPSGTWNQKGIVSLSDNVDSTSSTEAATPKAVNTVKTLVAGKANSVHSHTPADINIAGQFPVRVVAFSEQTPGIPMIRNIIISTSAPTSSAGSNGDIYLQYE